MPSLVERPRASQEALLRLEKGSASPSSQLHEAAQIIGVNLTLCDSHPTIQHVDQIQRKATPKEEWVLRWLLKKLRTGKNYRVNPTSFLLLRQLIDLISPKNLATILKDQKFLSIFCDSVADLEAEILTTAGNSLSITSFDSDSSYTLPDSSSQNGHRGLQGTKRKRVSSENEDDAMDLDDRPQDPASCLLAFIRVLDCLFGVVGLAQRTIGTDDNANSHLKLALRGGPEMVSLALGRALQMAAVAITRFSSAGRTTDLQHMFYVFPAVLEMWDSRSTRQDDADNKASNDYFARSCFAHSLRLQLCLRDVDLDTDEKAYLLHSIERVTALHVLLPARAAFFDRGGSGIDYSQDDPDWSSVKPVTDTFRPIIRESSFIETSHGKPEDQSFYPPGRSIELLPELFDNAVRAVPRNEFRRQTHEAPWLETLFVTVAELAYSVAKEADPLNFSPLFISVLEQLLRVALDRNVGLSLHTVLTHAGFTGLLQEGLEQVQWTVTALIISLGVDVFLPNSGLRDTQKLLDALLDKVMLQWRFNASNHGEYITIKNQIVLPLLRGFAAARDLRAFLDVWHDQLVILEEARSRDNSLPAFSVWEDDDICDTYCELLRASLVGSSLAMQTSSAAIRIRAEDGKILDTSQSYAKFLIMEAGFRGPALAFPDSEKTLSVILETVTSTLSSKQTLHWRWRLWRFLRNLLQNHQPSADSVINVATNYLTSVAAKTIHRNHKNLTKLPLAPLESWEAYRFALVRVTGKPNEDQLEKFNQLSKDITSLITSISSEDALHATRTPWNGRIDTLVSTDTLAVAYILALVRVPGAWERMVSDSRSRVLQQLLSLAASQYRSSNLHLEAVSDDAQFIQAWASVVCHEYLLNVPYLVPDLLLLLNKNIGNDPANRRLYVESLHRIPAGLITRGLRTSVLDQLHNVLIQQDCEPEVMVGILTMMAKLAVMPKCDAVVTSDWEPIWTAARAITLQGTDQDLQIMKSFRILHRAIIAKLLVLSENDRIDVFRKLFARVSKHASKLRQIDRDSMTCFLMRLALSEMWAHRKQLRKAFLEDELAACRQRVFGLVLADMKFVKDQCRKQKLEETITLIKTIDALEDFEDLATTNIEVEKFLSKIEHYMELSIDSAPSRLIRRRLLATKGSKKTIAEPMLQCAETLALHSLYAEDQQLFIKAATDRFRAMSAESVIQSIQEVRTLGLNGEGAAYRTLVIYLAINSLAPAEDKGSAVSHELSLLCTTITEAITHSSSIDQFCYAAESLAYLLRVHTRSLTQSNIDTILTAIAVSASKAGPQISPKYAPTIYTRLCRLMGLVLGLQRVKIGGRFHLVINALQRLLGCLFARSRKRIRSARLETTLSQPIWLAPLQASHATSYTRLLTTLCDPTVSAVLRPQPGASRDVLIDETKKAKRIAGQYLQYVIIEYTQCSLRGSLAPEVKASLMPGLYVALDVMSKESMRALSAALDASGRAVFKSLYDDYVKFGKWDKA